MVTQTLSALAVVLGALVLLRVALAALRPGVGGGSRALRVVESCALAPRQRLHVVEVDGQRLLIAAAEGQVRLLQALGEAHGSPAESRPAAVDAGPCEADRASTAAGGARATLRPRGAAALAAAARMLRTRLGGAGGLTLLGIGSIAGLLLTAQPAAAQSAAPVANALAGLDPGAAAAPDRIASTLEILALVTLVSVAPSLLLMGTCFTRIVIVLSLLRQAIGVNQLPPSQVLVGLALFLTVYAMAPVGQQLQAEALGPYIERRIDAAQALEAAQAPVRTFMLRHTREKDLALFAELSGAEALTSPGQVPLSTLLPSYMISELRTAFEIGFMLFLPFLVIDLVVASMLISMGMIVLPPIVISFPFKLMLFVLLDGWHLMVRSLMSGLV